MEVKFQTILQEIDMGKIRPSYLLMGENYSLIQFLIKEIENKLRTLKKVHKTIVYCDEKIEVDKFTQTLKSIPMGADCHLIILREFHKLSENLIKIVAEQLKKPLKGIILILTAFINPRKNLTIEGDKMLFCKCWDLRLNEAMEIMRRIAKKKRISIDNTTMKKLIEIVGTDIGMIESTLDILRLHFYPDRKIQIKDWENVPLFEGTKSLFALAESLKKGDFEQSFKIVHNLHESGKKAEEITIKVKRWYLDGLNYLLGKQEPSWFGRTLTEGMMLKDLLNVICMLYDMEKEIRTGSQSYIAFLKFLDKQSKRRSYA